MKKKNLFTLCALLFCGVLASVAQTTVLYQTTNTDTPYRIPAIAVAKNGDVIAVADHRLDKRDIGYGEVDMYARISTDNGANWGEATMIADGTGNSGFDCGFGDAAIVADRERNEVLIMTVAGKVVFANGSSTSHNHMAMIRGNYNETEKKWVWSTPTNVTDKFLGASSSLLPNAYTMFIASGRMLQSSYKAAGKEYYRVYAALLVKDSSSSYYNVVIYTDDFGANWSLLTSDKAITSADEAKVEELPNGDILISSRTKGGRIYNVYSMSTGEWNTEQIAYTFASNAEACNGELMIYKGLYKVGENSGKTYDVLLQSLPTASSRGNLKVYYQAVDNNSSLSTLTATGAWKEGKTIDSDKAAYSTMAIQADKKIGFMYEDNYTLKSLGLFQGNYDYADIAYLPISIEEMTNNAYTTVAPVVQTPVISPEAGDYEDQVSVSISCATNGASIYYTTDGSTPSMESALYEGSITLTESCTLNAIAVKDGFTASEVATATFTITQSGGGEGGETPDTPDTPFEGNTFAFTALEGKIGTQACGMATFSATVPTMVPAGVTAYYVRKADENIVTLTRISRSMAIPANEGVILMAGSAGDYEMTEAENGTSVAELTGNMLVGTCDKESTTLKSTDYVLALKGSGTLEGQFAFCLVGDMTVTQPANRAYLQMESGASQVRMMFDGNETSVDDVLAMPQGSAEYYDLTGRRVKKPAKGVYVVKGQIIVEE
ncbi:MAG: chitobiase/beta-hexosaminidase C-terminal domain-containing protein [Bacteroidaceae bacterium]|nr:chitobiase/beta-hexosaminidase C-terminal domain-containing protein [Bacteroidaceae bacterium]